MRAIYSCARAEYTCIARSARRPGGGSVGFMPMLPSIFFLDESHGGCAVSGRAGFARKALEGDEV